ncbi:MAG: hypothetical protein A2Z50_05260 [Nitrospirae bacterium RBG_19FT_COMBO_42_15]|nr:MAG: hypothetical protein A2Z50_05260 [Nitrospirae bacterium RBG_19FT_COMBO_42_15]
MKRILQISSKSKVRKAKAAEVKSLKEYGAMDIDSKAALIQELIPYFFLEKPKALFEALQ